MPPVRLLVPVLPPVVDGTAVALAPAAVFEMW